MAAALLIRQLDQDVYTLAKQRMRQIMADFDQVTVMFSGGKDSTAVLNVALDTLRENPYLRRHLPLRVVFYDEEAIPFETEEYVRRVGTIDEIELLWICLPVKHRNACSRSSPFWWPWAPEARDRWCRPLPPEAITEWPGFSIWPETSRLTIPEANGLMCPPERGNTAMLMGIRADESMIRRRAVTVSAGREYNYLVPYNPGAPAGLPTANPTGYRNIWKAYPIYDWTTDDVWTAPAKLGWDYNRAYDRMEMAGVSRGAQRCSPAFGEEPIGKLDTFATCFPDVWAAMVDRVPGVGAAVRYARTELYAFHGRPRKPGDTTWPEFLAHYVDMHAPGVDLVTARRLRKMIRGHYRVVSQPILEYAKHPNTGIDYQFLLMIAMRGDLKERKQQKTRLPPVDDHAANVKVWRAYADELAEIIAAGRFPELGYPGPPPADPYALIPAEYRQEAPDGR